MVRCAGSMELVHVFGCVGMGSNLYLTNNQAQHEIYCMNKLRKFVHFHHQYRNRTEDLEVHAVHCLHILLQSLHCKYSTDLNIVVWLENSHVPSRNLQHTSQMPDLR